METLEETRSLKKVRKEIGDESSEHMQWLHGYVDGLEEMYAAIVAQRPELAELAGGIVMEKMKAYKEGQEAFVRFWESERNKVLARLGRSPVLK